MTSYSRAELLDGKVPKPWAESVWGKPDNAQLLSEMVSVGLLGDADGDYVINRYAPRNQTKRMLLHDRKTAKERMNRVRANKRRTNGEQTGSVPTSTSISKISSLSGRSERDLQVTQSAEPDERGSHTRLRTTDDGAFGLTVNAWADGVRSITGAVFILPSPGSSELSKLVLALRAACGAGNTSCDDARRLGADFAAARAGEKLNAHAFVDWLNSGKPARQQRVANGRREVQPQGGQWETGSPWGPGGKPGDDGE